MNLKTFDLNLLRVFVALFEERHVSRAASRVNLSQPAVSNALMRLRRACDDPLFVRTSKGMEPTAMALQMASSIKRGLGVLDDCLARPFGGFEPDRSDRTFKLLMSDVGEGVVLPKLMQRLASLAPGVQVHALQVPHEDYGWLLQKGEADIAIGNLPFLKSGFYQQRVFSDNYVCVARANGPFSSPRTTVLAMSAYLEAAHLKVTSGNAEALIDAALAKQRRARNVRLNVAHYHVALTVVKQTDLLATVPRNAILDASSVVALTLPFRIPVAEVRQFWHERSHQDPGHEWLRSEIADLSLDG